MSGRRRGEAHEQQGQAVDHRLPAGQVALAVEHRQHGQPATGVVVPVDPGDGEEMGDLPEEQDGEQHERAAVERVPRAAAQPMTGGSAPGTAPTSVESEVRRLRGV